MTGGLVPMVVPSLALPPQSTLPRSARTSGHCPLPVARLIGTRERSTVYGLAAVDARGRVANYSVMRALGWQARTSLSVRLASGLIILTVGGDGQLGVTGQGDLRLPAAVRYACGIERGDRVLLVAEPTENLLVVHPPAALDQILGLVHDQVRAGEAG